MLRLLATDTHTQIRKSGVANLTKLQFSFTHSSIIRGH